MPTQHKMSCTVFIDNNCGQLKQNEWHSFIDNNCANSNKMSGTVLSITTVPTQTKWVYIYDKNCFNSFRMIVQFLSIKTVQTQTKWVGTVFIDKNCFNSFRMSCTVFIDKTVPTQHKIWVGTVYNRKLFQLIQNELAQFSSIKLCKLNTKWIVQFYR